MCFLFDACIVFVLDLDAAIYEVEKRLEYFAVAAQVEATMKMGFVYFLLNNDHFFFHVVHSLLVVQTRW